MDLTKNVTTAEEAITEDLIDLTAQIEFLKRNSPSTTTMAYEMAQKQLGEAMRAMVEVDLIKKGVPAHKLLVGGAVVGGNTSLVEAESWRNILSAMFPEEKITLISPYGEL